VNHHLSPTSLLMLKVTLSSQDLHYISSVNKYSSLSEGGWAARQDGLEDRMTMDSRRRCHSLPRPIRLSYSVRSKEPRRPTITVRSQPSLGICRQTCSRHAIPSHIDRRAVAMRFPPTCQNEAGDGDRPVPPSGQNPSFARRTSIINDHSHAVAWTAKHSPKYSTNIVKIPFVPTRSHFHVVNYGALSSTNYLWLPTLSILEHTA
jgi:hypothetical protein